MRLTFAGALAPSHAPSLRSAGASLLSLDILCVSTGKEYRWRNKVEQRKAKWYAKTNYTVITSLISHVLGKNEQNKEKDRSLPLLCGWD